MELELKFALPALDRLLLQKQLARCALIGRRHPHQERLHNVYYDTPDHVLKASGMALRVRQLGDTAQPRWVQTLKIGGAAASALSQRGEWELPLAADQLDADLLSGTPWTTFDPQGKVFAALTPVFSTTFDRMSWVVQQGKTRAEIALDLGEVLMDGHTTPLCELEIELLEGTPDALFEIASSIARHLSLMPLHMSKAERAYRLAQGTLDAPLRAKPPALDDSMDFAHIAQSVLRECFLQFTANLNALRNSDAPELLHQARIGWRRFKSALKLLRQTGEGSQLPARERLQPLLAAMTALRDLDVAATEVFPLYASAYQAEEAERTRNWQALEASLARERNNQREELRRTLSDPAVGQVLVQITRWLEIQPMLVPRELQSDKKATVGKWLKKRVAQLADQLDEMPSHSTDPAQLHALRILSKRLRYSVECLRPLLPARRAERWYQHATQQQTQIGVARDHQQALRIAQKLGAPEGIVEFLRGASFGSLRV
ncbi:CHAD domain-containing protein [Rhodoferax sp. GW822-FHT02A01]|uniref:CYTH and CHAD domain-containing protein n=1 Tax=Rhodoferax sp. GW822-FHT02A01 TaxID=3141537 RepID=UPI00315D40AC